MTDEHVETKCDPTTDLVLSHFSNEPYLRHVYSKQQRVADYRSCFDKPCGLWVSVDGEYDWQSWCESESFGIGRFRHQIYLSRDCNVLHLKSASDIMEFREHWGIEREDLWRDVYIPWEKVAKEYQGIIIAPYQWSRRMEESWYYGWDCASGCIWDASAIQCAEPLREVA